MFRIKFVLFNCSRVDESARGEVRRDPSTYNIVEVQYGGNTSSIGIYWKHLEDVELTKSAELSALQENKRSWNQKNSLPRGIRVASQS